MFSKCPRQDMGKLRVELFKCPKCGTMIFKEQLPTCIEWCSSARQCLGEERWKALMGDKKTPWTNSLRSKFVAAKTVRKIGRYPRAELVVL